MRTFTDAERAFADNINYLNPRKDAVLFNLSSGLSELTGALSAELTMMRQEIKDLRAEVAALKQTRI